MATTSGGVVPPKKAPAETDCGKWNVETLVRMRIARRRTWCRTPARVGKPAIRPCTRGLWAVIGDPPHGRKRMSRRRHAVIPMSFYL